VGLPARPIPAGGITAATERLPGSGSLKYHPFDAAPTWADVVTSAEANAGCKWLPDL